jgi:hypothetical protein
VDDLEQVGLQHLVVQKLQVVRDQVVALQLRIVLAHLNIASKRVAKHQHTLNVAEI